MKKTKKKHVVLLSVLGAVVVLITAGVIVITSYVSGFSEKVNAVTVGEIDLGAVSDGVYEGSYDLFPVSVDVKVTVKDHQITGIELVKHVNGKGKAAEALPGKVMEAQSLEVDVISGATASSKAILKAIDNALEKGK